MIFLWGAVAVWLGLNLLIAVGLLLAYFFSRKAETPAEAETPIVTPETAVVVLPTEMAADD